MSKEVYYLVWLDEQIDMAMAYCVPTARQDEYTQNVERLNVLKEAKVEYMKVFKLKEC